MESFKMALGDSASTANDVLQNMRIGMIPTMSIVILPFLLILPVVFALKPDFLKYFRWGMIPFCILQMIVGVFFYFNQVWALYTQFTFTAVFGIYALLTFHQDHLKFWAVFNLFNLMCSLGFMAFLGYAGGGGYGSNLIDAMGINTCETYYYGTDAKDKPTCYGYQSYLRFIAFFVIYLQFFFAFVSYMLWKDRQHAAEGVQSFSSSATVGAYTNIAE